MNIVAVESVEIECTNNDFVFRYGLQRFFLASLGSFIWDGRHVFEGNFFVSWRT